VQIVLLHLQSILQKNSKKEAQKDKRWKQGDAAASEIVWFTPLSLAAVSTTVANTYIDN
jgi:hypothetical protein